jgi:hypothetical protein
MWAAKPGCHSLQAQMHLSRKKQYDPHAAWLCIRYAVRINRYEFAMKPGVLPLQSARPLDQAREHVSFVHYTHKTVYSLPVLGALFRPLECHSGWLHALSKNMGMRVFEALLSILGYKRALASDRYGKAFFPALTWPVLRTVCKSGQRQSAQRSLTRRH